MSQTAASSKTTVVLLSPSSNLSTAFFSRNSGRVSREAMTKTPTTHLRALSHVHQILPLMGNWTPMYLSTVNVTVSHTPVLLKTSVNGRPYGQWYFLYTVESKVRTNLNKNLFFSILFYWKIFLQLNLLLAFANSYFNNSKDFIFLV